jgi:hypothetical protein
MFIFYYYSIIKYLIPNNPSNITSREKYTFNSTIHLFYINTTNPDTSYITRYRLHNQISLITHLFIIMYTLSSNTHE